MKPKITPVNLRPYQGNITASLKAELKKHKRVLIYAPTGAGKTIIAKNIMNSLVGKEINALFTTPRIKLCLQTAKSFGYGNLILGAKDKEDGSSCYIASIQSFYHRKTVLDLQFIFIDECHYAHDSKYLEYIFDNYPNAYIIGFSATPIDNKGYLLGGYDSIVNEVTVQELIDQGHLCDVDVYTSPYQPKMENVPIVNGDYNMDQASKVVMEESVLSNAMSEWQSRASKLKTLVFACDIKHADELVVKFSMLGIKTGVVHSKMKDSEITGAYDGFYMGYLQVLINVDMATFGFDEPSIQCIAFFRPIKSLRLYKQMVGRGLRPHKTKDKCLMLDCANVVLDNGYPTDEIIFTKKPVVNKTIDRLVNVERETDGTVSEEKHSKERIEYLTKIGSLIDLYANKVYRKEQELVDDCKVILKRAKHLHWRQNSGKMYKDGRWVHFTDKNGLPDITFLSKGVYIGLELKLPKGVLTKHQKETLPELISNGAIIFIIQNVVDLFEMLEMCIKYITTDSDGLHVSPKMWELNKKQREYRTKYRLPNYHDRFCD